MKALTVCVDYDDLLALTLPRNLQHLEEVLVVTAPQDERTKALVEETRGARCYITDAFYRGGAQFNKGAAVEEAFDQLGREGWMCIIDADTLLPQAVSWPNEVGFIYSAPRRMCREQDKAVAAVETYDWSGFKLGSDGEPAGYLQVFHARDPAIAGARPWYGLGWKGANGCDSDFSARWGRKKWRSLPFEVLHLGDDNLNWWGRQTKRLDGEQPRDAELHHQTHQEFWKLRRENRNIDAERLPLK